MIVMMLLLPWHQKTFKIVIMLRTKLLYVSTFTFRTYVCPNLREVDPGALSFPQLAAAMVSARVIVGVHGGQMSNIVFALADKNTAIIEIVGRQTPFTSYFYGGWGGAFSYYYVPRLCSSRRRHGENPKIVQAWGKARQGTTYPASCGTSRSHVLASLEDINHALDDALGVATDRNTCSRPKNVVQEVGKILRRVMAVP